MCHATDLQLIKDNPVKPLSIKANIITLNGRLGNFKIVFDDNEYDRVTKIKNFRNCNHCQEKSFNEVIDDDGIKSKEFFSIPSKIPCTEIRTFELRLTETQLMLVQFNKDYTTKTRKYWICPRCNNQNNCKDTPVSDLKNDTNNTWGFVWEFPERTMYNRSYYGKVVLEWRNQAIMEIEEAEVQYANEYFAQRGSTMEDDFNAGKFEHGDNRGA